MRNGLTSDTVRTSTLQNLIFAAIIACVDPVICVLSSIFAVELHPGVMLIVATAHLGREVGRPTQTNVAKYSSQRSRWILYWWWKGFVCLLFSFPDQKQPFNMSTINIGMFSNFRILFYFEGRAAVDSHENPGRGVPSNNLFWFLRPRRRKEATIFFYKTVSDWKSCRDAAILFRHFHGFRVLLRPIIPNIFDSRKRHCSPWFILFYFP